MTCEQTLELSRPHLEGELSGEHAAAVDGHFSTCEACKKKFEMKRQVVRILGHTVLSVLCLEVYYRCIKVVLLKIVTRGQFALMHDFYSWKSMECQPAQKSPQDSAFN